MEKTEKLTLRECLIGDRAFYRHVLVVVLPIIVQNTLTNVVSLLDNVMVGQVGTLPMSGVAVVGQLLFVYNLAVWGSTAGAICRGVSAHYARRACALRPDPVLCRHPA